jgi:hypothetical protein
MAKIKDIEGLREHALETLDKLAAGEIEITHATAVGKVCDSVINTVKTQLEYSRMINEERPTIKFLETAMDVPHGNLIEGKKVRKIGYSNEK